METEKLKRAAPYAKFNIFAAWPIVGITLIVFSIINFNNWGTTYSIIGILIGLFLLLYGIWAVKRAWARM